MKISVVIAVYNKIRELQLVLTALSTQTFGNFEAIVADDGSGEEMTRFIHQFQKNSPFEIVHVRQEDMGFRKNRILNKAIKRSGTDYLVFIDGDCIPHIDFVKAHYRNIKKNVILCGKRVNLSKKLSYEMTVERILNVKYKTVNLRHFIDSFRNKNERSTYVEEGVHLQNSFFRKILLEKNPHIVGCNFSLHKDLLEKINGFDENYIGPGIGEDSDIEYRLRLAGAEFHSLRYLAILYHLYHKSTNEEDKNYQYFEEVKKKKEYFCSNGLIRVRNEVQ